MRTQDRWFEDHRVGDSRDCGGRTITEADVVAHAGQTGDFFPHHMDAVWAATQPIGQRVAHGTLVLSVAVGMTAADINPQSTSYGYDRIRFVAPVHIGDTITVRATISAMTEHPRRPDVHGMLHELVEVTNQRGQMVLVLTHVYLVNRRRGQAAGPQPVA